MSLFRVDPKHPYMGPHQGEIVSTSGCPADEADAAMILVHGRGATAQSMLLFAKEFDQQNIAYRAPQAHRKVWYPYSFTAKIADNEPGISSGLQAIFEIIRDLNDEGIQNEKILLLGFSQGACLTLEYAARHPTGYGGIIGLSGGLLGKKVELNNYSGNLRNSPVFLGCSDNDPHIPEERVHKTARIFDTLNGNVKTEIYPGLDHTVNEDEIKNITELIEEATRK